jgi:DNA processing protein
MTASDGARDHAAALVGLQGMTPVRLAKLVDGIPPIEAWEAVRAGTHPSDPRHRFLGPARATDVEGVGEAYAGAGVSILLRDTAEYPSALAGDPGAPAVLFAVGDPSVVEERPRVAIVGTRSPTPYGLQVASEMAAELAREGVVVISGLAAGIDGAAHAGVLRGTGGCAPPVAVVGTGLDVPYPAQNREMWAEVAQTGAVFSESPLGTPPRPRVFPARNRIIAALSDVVVVVECHGKGGSLYTAEAAARRSIPVCAVPGSVRSRASDGTNGLLVDGCAPVRDATDVLVAVGLACAGTAGSARSVPPALSEHERTESPRGRAGSVVSSEVASAGPGDPIDGGDGIANHRSCGGPSTMSATQRAVLGAVDDTPTAFETILIRTDLSVASAAQACDELDDLGYLRAGAGWWSKV